MAGRNSGSRFVRCIGAAVRQYVSDRSQAGFLATCTLHAHTSRVSRNGRRANSHHQRKKCRNPSRAAESAPAEAGSPRPEICEKWGKELEQNLSGAHSPKTSHTLRVIARERHVV